MKRVVKSSGDIEKFSPSKVYRSVLLAGGSEKLAKETKKIIQKKYRPNITTQEIFSHVLRNLKKEKGVSERYYLKKAIMELGPSGFPFEQFFAKILENYGYKTKVDLKLKGKRIYHEVDIIAEKNFKYLIECKYHNEIGIKTKLHPALYTYARFLDLKKHNLDKAWLATNTKCSDDAKEYAKGVGMIITSWNYPPKESLKNLIELKKLYPVTIIRDLPKKIKERLFFEKIVMAKELLDFSPKQLAKKIGLSEKQAGKIIERAGEVI